MTGRLLLRGLLLFGCLLSIIKFLYFSWQLERAVRRQQTVFELESINTKLNRARFKILFGRKASEAQLEKCKEIEIIISNSTIPSKRAQRVTRRLMLARHIDFNSGAINHRVWQETLLKILWAILAVMATVFMTKLTIGIAQFETTIFASSVILGYYALVLGLPLLFYAYITFAPAMALRTVSNLG